MNQQWQQRIQNPFYNECIWIWRSTLHEFRVRQLWLIFGCLLLNNSFLKTPFAILMAKRHKSQKQSQWRIHTGNSISITDICMWRSTSEVFRSVQLRCFYGCHCSELSFLNNWFQIFISKQQNGSKHGIEMIRLGFPFTMGIDECKEMLLKSSGL